MNPTRESYKQKLAQFNATQKYQQEIDFLLRLMNPIPGEKILDYGCGLGRLVWQLVDAGIDAYGYDYINYREKDDLLRFRSEYLFKFDKVCLVHSIAHIPDIAQKLAVLKSGLNPGGKVYVITPNQHWINDIPAIPSYTPDPTVIEHFYLYSLKRLFTDAGFKITLSGQFGDQSSGLCERLFLEATV